MMSFLGVVWAFGLLYFFTLLLLGSLLQVIFPYDDLHTVTLRSNSYLLGFSILQFIVLVSGILLFDVMCSREGVLNDVIQLRASGVAFACMITGVTQPSYRIRLEELAFRFRQQCLGDTCPNPIARSIN